MLATLRKLFNDGGADLPDRAARPPVPGRRELLLGAPAAILLGGPASGSAAPSPAAASPGLAPIDSSFVDFADPRERFRAHFRFERDLRDEGEAVSWYHFTVYAVSPGVRPAPVVRFEGMEYSYFRRIGELTWRIHAHNLSFPRDIVSGRFTSSATSPHTGARVEVSPMALVEDPGVLHSPRGYLPLDARTPAWLESSVLFRIEGDLVKVEHTRPTPEAWPAMFIESSVSSVPRREFDDPRVTSLKFQTSGFYIFPWPKWMQMADRPGHMLGAWSGRKLIGPRELPLEFRERAAREHPELLAARWNEFDRPLPEMISRQLAASDKAGRG